MDVMISTCFVPAQQLLITRLSGVMDDRDIDRWYVSLESTLAEIPDDSTFKILVNLHGFVAADFSVHKRFRNIIPLLLAAYGYRIGYLDMFPESKPELMHTRGIRCLAMANVHHDSGKMNDYQARFGGPTEAYFTDPDAAMKWILNL